MMISNRFTRFLVRNEPPRLIRGGFVFGQPKIFLAFLVTLILLLVSCGSGKISDAEKLALLEKANNVVGQKGDILEALEIYKKLVTILPPKDDTRQRVLKYLMDTNINLINDKKGEEALKLALELNKIIPSDFYIQNRIIGAYRVLAEEQLSANNYPEASQFIEKALSIRFDADAMRTKLRILLEYAKDDIERNNTAAARKKIEEVIFIATLEENKLLFQEEQGKAEKLLLQITSVVR